MNQRESRHVKVAKIAYRLTKQALPKYSHTKKPHHFELPQLAACVLVMFYLNKRYRDMEEWLLATDHVSPSAFPLWSAMDLGINSPMIRFSPGFHRRAVCNWQQESVPIRMGYFPRGWLMDVVWYRHAANELAAFSLLERRRQKPRGVRNEHQLRANVDERRQQGMEHPKCG